MNYPIKYNFDQSTFKGAGLLDITQTPTTIQGVQASRWNGSVSFLHSGR